MDVACAWASVYGMYWCEWMMPSVVHVGAVQTTVCKCGLAAGGGGIVDVIPPIIVLVV